MINWSTEIIRFINLTRSDRRASEKYGTDVDNTWTKGPWLTIHEREKEIKKERKEGRKEGFARSIRGQTRSKSRRGWRTKRWNGRELTRYSSQTRTTAWKGRLDRDHSCRRLIRAIFHGKLSTDQRRKMKKVFFLTALTCANIPPIPPSFVALSKLFSKRKRVDRNPFNLLFEFDSKQTFSPHRWAKLEKDLFDAFRFKIRRQVYIGQHSSSSSLHDSRLLGNSINQAAISRDNN